MFNKRHYERIANILRDGISMERLRYDTKGQIMVDYTITDIVDDFIAMFKITSPNFKETVFRDACMPKELEETHDI